MFALGCMHSYIYPKGVKQRTLAVTSPRHSSETKVWKVGWLFYALAHVWSG